MNMYADAGLRADEHCVPVVINRFRRKIPSEGAAVATDSRSRGFSRFVSREPGLQVKEAKQKPRVKSEKKRVRERVKQKDVSWDSKR